MRIWRKEQLIIVLIFVAIISNTSIAYCGFLKFNSTDPIKGKIIDKITNKPIEGVELVFVWKSKDSLKPITKIIKSKKDGSFNIEKKVFWGCPMLGHRDYYVEITHPKYNNQTIKIATLVFKSPHKWSYFVEKELLIYLIPNR